MSESEKSTAEGRIEALETRLAYQDRAVEDLGKLVAEHEARLARVEGALRRVVDRIKDMADEQGSGSMPHERPPHY